MRVCVQVSTRVILLQYIKAQPQGWQTTLPYKPRRNPGQARHHDAAYMGTRDGQSLPQESSTLAMLTLPCCIASSSWQATAPVDVYSRAYRQHWS